MNKRLKIFLWVAISISIIGLGLEISGVILWTLSDYTHGGLGYNLMISGFLVMVFEAIGLYELNKGS
jgi:hypothetical protein